MSDEILPLDPNRSKEEKEAFDNLQKAFNSMLPFVPGTALNKSESDGYKGIQSKEIPPEVLKEAEIEKNKVLTPVDLVKSDKPILKVPETVDFAALPLERQQAITKAINRAKEQLGELQTHSPTQTQEQVDLALKVSKTIDSSKSESATKGSKILNNLAGLDKEKEPDKPKKEEDKLPTSGAAEESKVCQHCGWERDRPDPEELSEVDKGNFVQSILGQIPFRKRYKLLGGNVLIEFRNLDSYESDIIWMQTSLDAKAGDILDEAKYIRTLADYRMCLGLALVKIGSNTYKFPDSLEEWNLDPKSPTKGLKELVAQIYKTALKSESLRHAVASQFFRFQRLVERLEAHVDRPDFWKAIE
jgi:hypothetical protein